MVAIAFLGLLCIIVGAFIRLGNEYKSSLQLVGLVLILVGVIGSTYRSVPAGHRGVLLQFGAVRGVLNEGANFIVPFIQDVDLVDVRTQKSDAQADAASRDLQTVRTDVVVNYHISPKSVGYLYKTVGTDYEARIINPAVQEIVKAVIANFTAEDLIKRRSDVKAQVDTLLSQRLLQYNIIVEVGGVSLTNFSFSDQFNAAIEAKQVAQQKAEQQKYVLQQAQLEAQTAITTAKGEAEANRIKAEALNTQGGQKVLARAWIEKWDGHLPTVTGSGQTILDLKELIGEK